MKTLRPAPRDLQVMVELADRLDRSWFFTRTRERLRDGDRENAKKLRTMRGVRLLTYWHISYEKRMAYWQNVIDNMSPEERATLDAMAELDRLDPL